LSNQRLGFQHIKRLEEISLILLRFGFKEWLVRLHLGKNLKSLKVPFLKPKKISIPETDCKESEPETKAKNGLNTWQRLRCALENLGPTFIKFGQILSNRADILPQALIAELSKLQDQVPAFAPEDAKRILEQELGQGLTKLFLSFNETAVASASIAQVHEAYLHNGRRVAVKIQRPGIEPIIAQDLDIMAFLARLVERHLPEYRQLDPSGMVAEFSKQIRKELDFKLELQNMERFGELFQGSKLLYAPKPWPKFSTGRVITMEFIQGQKLSSLLDASRPQDFKQVNREILAKRLAEAMLEQVFIHGFFHADPHPGNILVLPGDLPCFLDFGMMGRIQKSEQQILAKLLEGLLKQNSHQVTVRLLELANYNPSDVPNLEYEIAEFLELYFDRPMKNLNVAEVFQDLLKIVQNHKIAIPSKYLLLGKALLISEGLGSQLSPDFSLYEYFKIFAAKLALKRLNPEEMLKEGLRYADTYKELIQDFPLDSMQILKLIRQGRLSINFRIKDLEPLARSLEHTGTQLVFGLVLASILISSSLIIRSNVPPLINGVPVIGLIGFGIAGLMSFGFLLAILVRLWRKPKKGDT